MGFFNFGKKQEMSQPTPPAVQIEYQQFGSPIVKVGGGDITKPYIQSYVKNDAYVRFGADNLYPQLIDQMYYQSPLHSAIIDFQINAAIGGGFEINLNTEKSARQIVDEKTFIKVNKFNKLIRAAALDIKMHGRSHLLIYKKDGKPYKFERVLPSKVRYNAVKNNYTISYDWLTTSGQRFYPAYSPICDDEVSVFSFLNLENSPGQDVYPLPKEISAFNWIFLDGQSSTLSKMSIERSIYGSIVIRRPKEFASKEELEKFKKEIKTKEGEVTPVLLFTGNGLENTPTVESFPVNENDKLFKEMFHRIDEKICQAHSINPVLLLEGTGGLGSGSDITAVYPIYEKNVILPFRSLIEQYMNDVLFIFSIPGKFKLNNFQIIDGLIVESDGSKIDLPINDDVEANAKAQLKGSVGGVQGIIQIQTSVAQGLTDRGSAIALLELIYGFSNKEASRLLGDVKEGVLDNNITTKNPTTKNPSNEVQAEAEINNAMRGLTAQENADVYRIIRDYNKERLPLAIAKARLKNYGFDDDTINEILEIKE